MFVLKSIPTCSVLLMLLQLAMLAHAFGTLPKPQTTLRVPSLVPLYLAKDSNDSSGEDSPHDNENSEKKAQTPPEETDPAFKYYNHDPDSYDDGDDDDTIVTREMLWRDLLEDPQVKRKKNKNRYKTLDNRDSLPFVVRLVTPDPYTPPKEKREEAKRNTQQSKKNKPNKQTDLTLGAANGIAASIYTQQDDGSLERILGEFHLDKSTNCGDVLQVGNQEFEVQTARCQYKYAGGKRFVMVRKILEVKKVTRVAEENYLQRQFQKSPLKEEPPQLE